jgi:hypothetical protein
MKSKQVHVYYQTKDKGPVEPLIRCRPQLNAIGWNLDFHPDSPLTISDHGDLILLQQYYATSSNLDKSPVPIALLERADASISWCRVPTRHPVVKRVLKIATLLNPTHNNFTAGRYHSILLDPSLQKPPSSLLEKEHTDKLIPGPSYHAYDLMARWVDIDIDFPNRPYDIHFAGTLVYGDRQEITNHRQSCLDVILNIPGNHILPRPSLSRDAYNGTMRQSKIVVSPWGYGEVTYRDFEALYAGCVLIKPKTNHLTTWPNIFIDGQNYLSCESDWSDLTEKIGFVINHWSDFDQMRAKNRSMLLHFWDPQVIAKYYDSIFRDCLL